jgi:predicted regulator of Ras-like GTPase activity (Roadblock/LC7/MglB family)
VSRQSELEDALQELVEATGHSHGAVLAAGDGLPIVAILPEAEVPRMAALASTVADLSHHVASAVGVGRVLETVIRGDRGCLAVYELADVEATLAVATTVDANLGLVFLEAQAASELLAELLR